MFLVKKVCILQIFKRNIQLARLFFQGPRRGRVTNFPSLFITETKFSKQIEKITSKSSSVIFPGISIALVHLIEMASIEMTIEA